MGNLVFFVLGFFVAIVVIPILWAIWAIIDDTIQDYKSGKYKE